MRMASSIRKDVAEGLIPSLGTFSEETFEYNCTQDENLPTFPRWASNHRGTTSWVFNIDFAYFAFIIWLLSVTRYFKPEKGF